MNRKWLIWALLAIAAFVIPGGILAMLFMWPAKGRISSPFMKRRVDPVDGKTVKDHNGMDIAAPLGSPVHAVLDGIVQRSYLSDSYGNRVILKHDGNLETTYNHLSNRTVSDGQKVKKGDLLGTVGSTGHSTGPHLHFEVKLAGRFVDPAAYLG